LKKEGGMRIKKGCVGGQGRGGDGVGKGVVGVEGGGGRMSTVLKGVGGGIIGFEV